MTTAFTPTEPGAYRQYLRRGSPASKFCAVAENDLARADGHLVTPPYIKNLAGTKRRKTTEPARITAQQSLGEEPEALLAALSLGAIFVVILMSVVMKLFLP